MNLEKYLYKSFKENMSQWHEKDIYCISILVRADEICLDEGKNFLEVSIGYNTESEAKGTAKYSEERWNYAFWKQNEVEVISIEDDVSSQLLLKWFDEKGITDIGAVDEDDEYDAEMNYIGKGPKGYFELLMLVSSVAKRLHDDGIIIDLFGEIPIIVHDMEYAWYVKKATINANPEGMVDDFIKMFEMNFES